MNQTLLVNKSDFSDVTLVNMDMGPLAEDHIRLEIGPFALTADHITYLVTGDMIGYWDYFAPEAYGIDQPGTGRMPVWGYATVVESNVAKIEVGEKIYGFYPVAKYIDMEPAKITQTGFLDGIAHRRELHSVYNSYSRTDNDKSFTEPLFDLQPLLRPLFTTSFLIDDQFADHRHYGAQQILILSASSKTALGTAFCMQQRGGKRIIGLTSPKNQTFTRKTGFYDRVETYDFVDELNPALPIAVIDMAGNGDVTKSIYDHFGENLIYYCLVGKSHWKGGHLPDVGEGAEPIMFFAPDRARQRIDEWGTTVFARQLAARWVPFCKSAKGWLKVEKAQGIEAFLPVYKELLEGNTSPKKGYLFSL